MKWHTDTTKLWTRSTAENLFNVMYTDPLRDEIMYWLTPRDAVEFVVATGILFSNKDMAKYTSAFKYIITNRRWLMKKMKEGFTFTMMGTNLCTMMDYNVGSDRAYDVLRNHSINAWSFRVVHVTLIVTNDEHYIPCTEEFMPMHLFLTSKNHEHTDENTVADINGIVSRYVQTNWNGIKIHIACPITNQITFGPLTINDKICRLVPHQAYLKRSRRIYATSYSHMSNGKCMISRVIEPVLSVGRQLRSRERVLFEIEVQLPSNKGMKMMVYTVLEPNAMGGTAVPDTARVYGQKHGHSGKASWPGI
ncbi:hypothetical protein LTR56_012485 [Elasticomyces elasticus]|nr:hypothetical protein LTR22_023216 [Elasticomyces elasticus]KAK3639317.1 hypothetical protein LTR56_012485 [Elasticomyces elasticus]KAK4907335.1 hypothetical protein LTR49_023619 [Elasticomyces elasticus]KAK5748395.1 hypothetical protein LTS12_021567 [Elasticomyces elasticus]